MKLRSHPVAAAPAVPLTGAAAPGAPTAALRRPVGVAAPRVPVPVGVAVPLPVATAYRVPAPMAVAPMAATG